MYKQETDNQTLPGGVSPMEGTAEKIKYSEGYENAIEKKLWSGKDNEGSFLRV